MPSILYKYILGEELVFSDVKKVNLNTANSVESMGQDPSSLEYSETTFTLPLMDGTEAELIPGGRNILVT